MAKPDYRKIIKAPEYRQRRDNVEGHLNRITATDNPLMTLARTQGKQEANRRGLLSSSMAIGAAQDSAYRAAVPLAQQTASQNFQKNLSNQQFEQESTTQARDLASREGMQGRDIAAQVRMQGTDIRSREGMQLADIAAQKDRLGLQLSSQEREALKNRNQQLRMQQKDQTFTAAQRKMEQERDIAAQVRMQGTDIRSREGMQLADIAAQKDRLGLQLSSQEREALKNRNQQLRMQQKDQTFTAAQRKMEQERDAAQQARLQTNQITADRKDRMLDRKSNKLLASWNLDSNERQQAASLLASTNQVHAAQVQSVLSNTAMTAKDREAILAGLKASNKKRLDLVRQLYNVEIDF